ncbi:MAG: hypothetical protein ACSLFE_06355 [Gemmatimonadaceae bacterium]
MIEQNSRPGARRHFLAQLSGGLAAIAGISAPVAAQQVSAALTDPDHDAWMQLARGEHRALFHATSPGDGAPMLMAMNYLDVYGSAYGAQRDHVSAVVGVHGAALPIALNDGAWDRYELGRRINVNDPITKEPAKRNVFAVGGPYSIDTAMGRGVVLLVCNMALTLTARSIARARSLVEADVYNDLKSSVLPGGILVPGLVVAISRAQEKGFTYIRAS